MSTNSQHRAGAQQKSGSRIIDSTEGTGLTYYLAIGPLCWGRATSISAAIAQMHQHSDHDRLDYGYVVVKAHSSSFVNQRGEIETPLDRPRPQLVRRVQAPVS